MMIKKILILLLIPLYTFNSIHSIMSPRYSWVDYDGGDSRWCKDNKEALKEKFIRARRLLTLEQEAEKKGNTAEEEYQEIKKLRFSEYTPAWITLIDVFSARVTKDKIEAYLEVTKTNPNTPLD
jgi:hypothetical protein